MAFVPGNGLVPKKPGNEDEVHLDTETSLVETWKAMIRLRDTGKVCYTSLSRIFPRLTSLPPSQVKAIGVSNFTIAQIQGIIDATGVVPVCLP